VIVSQFPSSAGVFSKLIVIYLFENIITFDFFEIVSALILEKHISFYGRFIEIFIISSNGVIGKMDELVAHLFCIVVDC
jgi:hypothetical protein